ncbi:MAG: class II fructose-bisphosphate aldolase [Planctomycetota bacterium]|jgi:fructose/tagatose bisphosphate aldolase|nr:class II fructose-bisphosphate aldolase [Planctomycetota bacterium]
MNDPDLSRLILAYEDILSLEGEDLVVLDAGRLRDEAIDSLVREAVFGETDGRKQAARWIIRQAGSSLGIHPASIHEYYLTRGKGSCPGATTPAINVRSLAYDTSRAIFRSAQKLQVGALIFEIARSEIGYTHQRPAEYAAVITAAAIAEGFQGPVFIQGDHFQVNAKKYAADPETELGNLRDLIREALAAGFYNLDLDSSTLVDLSHDTIEAQQETNARVAAELTAFVRQHEPEGVTVSVGGEIGEVGKQNSTPEELRAFMSQYESAREALGVEPGLSKISIQTGTSHGGVVLPDGSLQEVAIDFDCLDQLGQLARDDYEMGGAVQHGASTLPAECFDRFSQADAVEVHLATNFQNILLDHPEFPEELREEITSWLDTHMGSERKEGQTDEQFHYSLRKKALGPFKRKIWDLPASTRSAICSDLEKNFSMLFEKLGVTNTREDVIASTSIVEIHPSLVAATVIAEDDTSLDD